MDVFDRVKMLAERDKISISALEKKLGFSNKSLYPHKKDSTIRGDRIVALAKYFHVTTDWLLTGEDPRYEIKEQELIATYRQLNDEGKEEVSHYANYIWSNPKYKKPNMVKEVG